LTGLFIICLTCLMFSPQKAHVSSIPIPSSPFLEIISLYLCFLI